MDGFPQGGGRTRRRRGLGVAISLAVHVAVGLAVIWAHPIPPKPYDPPAISVALVTLPPPPKPPEPPAPVIAPAPPAPVKAEKPEPPKATKRVKVEKAVQHHTRARPSPPHPSPVVLAADPHPAADPGVELSEAELAGALRSGGGDGGGGGGRCDMTRRIQETLRKDPLVQQAVAPYAGKAVRVWNGDWLWFQGDDGKGLTAVRQAMMWEIAFSPAECKHQPMHGLVLLSANDRHGSVRLAVGAGAWTWSDLLIPHPGVNHPPAD
jgi:hypothetical protein